MTRVGHALRALGSGVWHFVVGDAPEFAVAVAGIVAFAVLFHDLRALAVIGLPLLVLSVLCGSVWSRRRIR